MLTRRVATDSGPQINPNWLIAAVIGLVFFGGIVWTLIGWQGFSAQAPTIPAEVDPVRMLGAALVSPNGFVLAFELASVLLLAALIGAIIVAWERK
jgi:NADH-quinone oxidoreductase subunit J